MRKLFINLTVCLVTIVLMLSAAEFALRLVYDHELSGSWRVFDDRGLRLNKSAGTFPHHRVGYSTTYSFRYPHLRSGNATDGAHRILVLGESFTFGWLLDWHDTYVGQLEDRIQAEFGPSVFEIANAAVGGWGVDSYLAYLEGYGEEVDPDIVLVFLNTDDIERATKYGLYEMKDGRLVASEVPVSFPRRLVKALPAYNYLLSRSYLVDAVRTAYVNLRYGEADGQLFWGPGMENGEAMVSTPQDLEAVRLGRVIFEKIIEWCAERDATLLVLTTAWHNPPYRGKNANELFMADASKFFAARQVKYFDGSDQLIERKLDLNTPIYIANDGHPNEEGARLIAEINWPFLKAKLTEFCKLKTCAQD